MFALSSVTKKEKGQGLVEYAIILALVAIVVIGSMTILGPKIGNTFNTISDSLPGGGGHAQDPQAACEAARAAHNSWHNTWDGSPNADFSQLDALHAAIGSACGQ